jgi:hypothetical protein
MVQLQDSILKCLHHHTFFYHVLQHDIWGPLCSNFIMFWPKGKHLAYSLTNLSSLSIIIPSFLHTTLYITWITPSFNCKHPSMCIHTFINPMGIHLLHCAHGNECMMQFTTPLLPLCKMFVSTSNENNYMRFFQPHSTHWVNELTLCLPNMTFAL